MSKLLGRPRSQMKSAPPHLLHVGVLHVGKRAPAKLLVSFALSPIFFLNLAHVNRSILKERRALSAMGSLPICSRAST